MKLSLLTYRERISLHQHPLAQQLLRLMDLKQTNLALSADVTQAQALLQLADMLGPEICILKTHIDILEDFTPELTNQLCKLSQKHQFLIFEDRKFADIGQTVLHQYRDGIYRIADWAHIINAHALPGPGLLLGLKRIGLPLNRGCLLLAQMSSADNLFDEAYIHATLNLAQQHREFVVGFIAQERLLKTPDFIYLTPGVQLSASGDDLGQRYSDPYHIIFEQGSDVLIVGRGIYEAANPLKSAQQFRAIGWQAYLDRSLAGNCRF